MKKGKRRARRLALYLRSIGIRPWASGLQVQYDELEAEQRKLARRAGRQLIQEAGSIAKAVAALPSPVVLQPLVGNAPPVAPRTQSREEQFNSICKRWSALTPPCPSCRMGNGFPKRSWPTREWADEVWGKQVLWMFVNIRVLGKQPRLPFPRESLIQYAVALLQLQYSWICTQLGTARCREAAAIAWRIVGLLALTEAAEPLPPRLLVLLERQSR